MKALGIPARLAVVGLICAAVHNAILITGAWLHVHYAISCAVSYVVVVALGFALHLSFTFQQQPTLAAFWRYAVAMAANYPITLALLFAMCDVAGWPVVVAAPVATVLMVIWNFLASRWAIVRNPIAGASAASEPQS
jgi:putative flippase GtrA